MGAFKDLRDLRKLGKDNQRNVDVKERMAQARASMAGMSQVLADQASAATLAAEGLPATATLVAIRDTGTRVNMDPVLEVDLLVARDGQLPYAATVTQTVALAYLGRAVVGADLTVRVSRDDMAAVWIDWSALQG